MNRKLPVHQPNHDAQIAPYAYPPSKAEPQHRGLILELRMFAERRWRLMLITFVIVTAVVAIIQLIQPRQYTSYASIFINPRPQQEVTTTTPKTFGTNPDSAFVDSEIEFLNSRFIAGRVADDLKLSKDPYWNSALNPPTILGLVKSAIKGVLSPGGSGQLPTEIEEFQREKVITKVDEGISVSRFGLSYAVRVGATSHSARQAADMANAIVEIYKTNNTNSQTEDAERANLWLAEQIEKLQNDISAKEAAVEQHRRETGLIEINDELLIERKLRNAEVLVLEARAELSNKKVLLAQLEKTNPSNLSAKTLPSDQATQVIDDLLVQEAALNARQINLEQTFGERYSLVVNGRLLLKQIRQQINQEIQRIVASVRLDSAIAEEKLKVLERQFVSTQREFLNQNKAVDRLRELEGEATSVRDARNKLVERQQDIEGQEQYAASKIRVLAPAALPTLPSSPRLLLALALALSLGVGTAVMSGLVADQFESGKVRSKEQLFELTGYPVIASIPSIGPKGRRKNATLLEHIANMPSAEYEAYENAMGSLFYTIKNNHEVSHANRAVPVISFQSALPGEGKTQISIATAMIAEHSGLNVLLIECDYQQRGLSKLFSITPKGGLIDVLHRNQYLEDCLLNYDGSNIDVLPVCSGLIERQSLGIDPTSFADLLQDVTNQYDIVILDSPSILSTTDALIIAQASDQSYLIARSRQTKVDAMNAAVNQLLHYSNSLSGMILNGVHGSTNTASSFGNPRNNSQNFNKTYRQS